MLMNFLWVRCYTWKYAHHSDGSGEMNPMLVVPYHFFFLTGHRGEQKALPPEYIPLIIKDRAEKTHFSKFYIRG
jgi:hypothetical protein